MKAVEKYVREAMPIQEEESASGNRCKGETNIESVVNKQLELDSDGTEKMGRHSSEKIQGPFIASRCQNSLLNFFDLENLVNAKKSCQRIQDIGQTK